jgi:hypothetical protein
MIKPTLLLKQKVFMLLVVDGVSAELYLGVTLVKHEKKVI